MLEYIDEYNDFNNNHMLFEKFDDNLIKELKKKGITDEREIDDMVHLAHRGELGNYLTTHGQLFTFGLLRAIYKDSFNARKDRNIKKGVVKSTVRLIPSLFGPFIPIIAVIGTIMGSTRAIDKIIIPLVKESHNSYPDFLKSMILKAVDVVEGNINIKNRFMRAFVMSDDIIDMLNDAVVTDFAIYLSNKMSKEDDETVVPDYYIENNLREYLNNEYGLNPPLPMNN